MSTIVTDKMPPAPHLVSMVTDRGNKKALVTVEWQRWFLQVQYKIDSINQNLYEVSNVVGDGFAVRNPDGTWTTTSIVPVGSGGTGLNAVGANNFLRGTGAGALEERTPADVLDDINAQAKFGTTHSSATAGSAAALPSLPVGYVDVEIGGTTRRIPFYD